MSRALRAECVLTLKILFRQPGFWVPTVLFPAMLYGFFGAQSGGGQWAANAMAARTARIVRSTDLPVMADGDNGFGNAVNTFLTVREFEAAGAAGINLEDQQQPKRCGHLDGKQIIPTAEMVQKLRAAVEARRDPDLVINARTDSLAVTGMRRAFPSMPPAPRRRPG